jgi:hypothetical protein
VIVVEYDPNTGIAKFNDFSRMIEKEVQIEPGLTTETHQGRRAIADQVMAEYDHNRGKYIGHRDGPRRDVNEIVHLFRI